MLGHMSDVADSQRSCQERAHYPIYDPSNPEHHGSLPSCVSPDQCERTTPKKSRLQTIAQGVQDTLRAKAAYFYVQPTSERSISPPTDSISKKTVRFRQGHSSIDQDGQLMISSAAIWQDSPKLPQLSFPQTSLLPIPACSTDWNAQKEYNTTPSPSVSPMILPSPLGESTSMLDLRLLLEDPFDDVHTTECDPVMPAKSPESLNLVVKRDGTSRESSGSYYPDSEGSRCDNPSLIRLPSSHSGTDKEGSTLTDVQYSTAMKMGEGGHHDPKSEQSDYIAASPLEAKSNSRPLWDCGTEIDKADFGVAAQRIGHENVPMVPHASLRTLARLIKE